MSLIRISAAPGQGAAPGGGGGGNLEELDSITVSGSKTNVMQVGNFSVSDETSIIRIEIGWLVGSAVNSTGALTVNGNTNLTLAQKWSSSGVLTSTTSQIQGSKSIGASMFFAFNIEMRPGTVYGGAALVESQHNSYDIRSLDFSTASPYTTCEFRSSQADGIDIGSFMKAYRFR